MALKGKNTPNTTETTEADVNTNTEELLTTPTPETKEVATKPKTHSPVRTMTGGSVFINNPNFLEAVAGAEYGTFASVTASNGTHKAGNDDLGKVIKFQAILAKEVMKIVPGSNDEEAKEYFQVSADGETVPDGRTLDEALEDAIEAGYLKAAKKKYIDVICLIVDSENEYFIGETMTLQLSPTSQFSWKPLEGKCKMKAAMGKLKAEPVAGNADLGSAVVFTSTATPDTFNKNDFTKFVFSMD